MLLAVLLGIIAGVITGLIPGVHVNLIAMLVLVLPPDEKTAIFLISMGITHTFLDAIPSVLLGVPEESTALIVMPAHRLLLNGHGFKAVMLATAGGLFSMLFILLLSPFLVLIRPFNPKLIIIIISLIIVLKNKLWGLVIFLLSGSLGLIAFSFHNPLLPVFSGMFGVSSLLFSFHSMPEFPKQNIRPKFHLGFLSVLGASLGGLITGILPGVTSSISAVIGRFLIKSDEDYIALVGGSNTANFFASLFFLYSLGKARNGVLVAVSQLVSLNFHKLLVFVSVAVASSGIAAVITVFVSRFLLNRIDKVNYRKTSLLVMLLILLFSFIFSGWHGVLILIVATAIGVLPHLTGTAKYTCMGVLLIPIIIR